MTHLLCRRRLQPARLRASTATFQGKTFARVVPGRETIPNQKNICRTDELHQYFLGAVPTKSYSAASLAELFLGLLFAFFSTGAKNLPV